MSHEQLQDLFIKVNVVIRGVGHRQMAFDRRGLERLGSWDTVRTIQGQIVLINSNGNTLTQHKISQLSLMVMALLVE